LNRSDLFLFFLKVQIIPMPLKSTVLLLFFLSASLSAFAQTATDEQIKAIRKEFQSINGNLKNYKVKYSAKHYPGSPGAPEMSIPYTAYFNSKDQMVMLTSEGGEEGVWNKTEYYFKDSKIIFIYNLEENEHDPIETTTELRVYFCDNRIIQALIKEKTENGEQDLSKIKNKRFNSVMDNLDAATKSWLKTVDEEIKTFYEGLRK